MASIFARSDALDVNVPQGDTHLSDNGSDYLYSVTALFTFFFLINYALTFRPHNGEKIFHYIFAIALLAGGVAYYAQASGLAYVVVEQHLWTGDAATFQLFWAKYVAWTVTFPTIILGLGLVSGASWATIVFNIFLSWAWVLAYLCSAVTPNRYKWGFYGFGTIAYLFLALQTLLFGRSSAVKIGAAVSHYTILAGFANLVWLGYPIAFAVSDGGNYLSVTESLIFFGVLDTILVIGSSVGFWWFSRSWDYGRMNLHFTQYGRVGTTPGVVPEKPVEPTPAPAAV